MQRGDALVCLVQVRNLKVGPGIAADTDIGPVISRESKERIERLIQSAIDQVSLAAWFPSRTGIPSRHGIPRGMVSLAAWYPTSAWQLVDTMQRGIPRSEASDGAMQGAKVLLDGRGVKVPGHEHGNWVGPTVRSAPTAEVQQQTLRASCRGARGGGASRRVARRQRCSMQHGSIFMPHCTDCFKKLWKPSRIPQKRPTTFARRSSAFDSRR